MQKQDFKWNISGSEWIVNFEVELYTFHKVFGNFFPWNDLFLAYISESYLPIPSPLVKENYLLSWFPIFHFY